MSQQHRPEAHLYISPQCAHCPAVLEALTRLLKEDKLARLEIINIAARPELAAAEDVHSVPLTRIGPFQLPGAQSYRELAQWVAFAATESGTGAYYLYLLEQQQLDQVIKKIREVPASLRDLVLALDLPGTGMGARIGISAVLESLQDSNLLKNIVPDLEHLANSPEAAIRADACHLLGLTEDPTAIPTVRRLIEDSDPNVREIALETLPLLVAPPL